MLKVKLNVKSAIKNFIAAYILVTILAYLASYLVGTIEHLSADIPPGGTMFDSQEFVKSVPYHLLINLLIWTIFSYVYFRKNKNRESDITTAIYLGIYWLVLAMLTDLVFFVLIPSPVALTFRQFYIGYQPWIAITYLIVFISPLLSYGLVRNSRK